MPFKHRKKKMVPDSLLAVTIVTIFGHAWQPQEWTRNVQPPTREEVVPGPSSIGEEAQRVSVSISVWLRRAALSECYNMFFLWIIKTPLTAWPFFPLLTWQRWSCSIFILLPSLFLLSTATFPFSSHRPPSLNHLSHHLHSQFTALHSRELLATVSGKSVLQKQGVWGWYFCSRVGKAAEEIIST